MSCDQWNKFLQMKRPIVAYHGHATRLSLLKLNLYNDVIPIHSSFCFLVNQCASLIEPTCLLDQDLFVTFQFVAHFIFSTAFVSLVLFSSEFGTRIFGRKRLTDPRIYFIEVWFIDYFVDRVQVFAVGLIDSHLVQYLHDTHLVKHYIFTAVIIGRFSFVDNYKFGLIRVWCLH